MQDIKDRIEWIDIAKGIGIILVIAGHTISLQYSQCLYTFHLPLFFFLSGLVFNQKKYERFFFLFGQKSQQILLPWLAFFLVGLLVCLLIPDWRDALSVRQMLIDLYTTNTNNIQNSSIWYLVCLFVTFCVFWFVNKIKRNKLTITLLIIIAICLLWQKEVLLYVSHNIVEIPCDRLPFKIDSASVACVFFAVAAWNKDKIKEIFLRNYSWWMLIVSSIVFVVIAILNGWTNLNSLDFGRIRPLFYPIAFTGIVLVCFISKKIAELNNSQIKRWLTMYGECSLLIFGLQSIFIRLYLYTFNKIENLNMELYMDNQKIHQIGSFVVVAFVVSPLLILARNRIKRK